MDDRQPVSLARRALSYLICYLVAVQPMLPAAAAAITPVTPGTKMDAAGNGVPVVNIATPNQAGVSHNQYQQYNVGKEGLILNNATGQLNQTQLGGLIQNNPNLKAGHEAHAIINEVTGANRSQLQGYTEVAGKAANVMVANPYGITCNGCGFINTPNVTLTTGKPKLDANGNLSALEISKGSVIVEGQGLDGSSADAVSIVARATQINAGIHAKDLSLTLGANRVGSDGTVTPIAGEGAAPSVAVDTGALGGMYANRIHLVSSDKGVGVNLGNLNARQGDMVLDANGRLAINNSLTSGAVSIKGEGVTLSGDHKATGAITVQSQQDVALRNGALVTDGTLSVTGKGNLTANGISMTAGRDIKLNGADLTIDSAGSGNAGGDIQLGAQNRIDNAGQLMATKNITLTARQTQNSGMIGAKAGNTLNSDALTNSGKLVGDTLHSKGRLLNNSGEIVGGTLTEIAADRLENAQRGTINSAGNLQITGTDLINQGTLSAPDLTLNGTQIDNGGLIQGSRSLNLTGSLLNNLASGTLSSDNSFALNLPELNNSGLIHSAADLSLSGGTLVNAGEISSASLTASNTSLTNQQGGLLLADKNMQLNQQQLSNQGEVAASDLAIKAAQLTNSGTLQGSQTLKTSGGSLTNNGKMVGGSLAEIAADRLENAQSGTINSAGNLKITGTDLINQGTLSAPELTLNGTQIDNGGLIQGSRSLTLTGSLLNNLASGTLSSDNSFALNLPELNNSGLIHSAADLSLSGGTLVNDGEINGANLIASNASLTNQQGGLLLADKNMQLDQQQLSNQGLVAASDLAIKAAQLTNTGTLQGSQVLQTSGDSLTNSGTLLSAGQLTVNANNLKNQGLLQGRNLSVQAGEWQNSGNALSEEEAQLQAKRLSNSGKILGQQAINLQTDSADNQGQLIARALTLKGDLINSGLIQGNDSLSLNGGDLSNKAGGELISAGKLDIHGTTLDNQGSLQASSINLAAQRWQNTGAARASSQLTAEIAGELHNDGTLLSEQAMTLRANALFNTGTLAADQLSLSAAQLVNSGLLQGNSTLSLDSAQIVNQARGRLLSSGSLTLAPDLLENNGLLQVADTLDINGRNVTNNGQVTARDLTTHLSGTLTNGADAQLIAQQQADVQAATLDNSGTLAAAQLTTAGNTLRNRGLLQGDTALTADFQQLNNQTGGKMLSGGELSLRGNNASNDGAWQGEKLGFIFDALNNHGTLSSTGTLDGTTQGELNNSGILLSNGNTTLQTGSLINSGKISADNLTLRGSTLNSSGLLQGNSSLDAQADNLTTAANSKTLTAGALTLNATQLNTTGTLQGAQAVVNTDSWQHQGSLLGSNALQVSVGGELTNGGELLTHGGAQIGAQTLINKGSLLSEQAMTLTGGALNNSGTVQGKTLTITPASVINQGSLIGLQALTFAALPQAPGRMMLMALATPARVLTNNAGGALLTQGTLTLNGGEVTNNGNWQAQQVLLDAQRLTNNGAIQSADGMQLLLGDRLDAGAGSKISAGGAAVLQANSLVNQGQWIASNLTLNGGTLNNNGEISGVQGLGIKLSGALTQQQDKTLLTAGKLTLQAASLNNAGRIQGGELEVTSGTVVNNGRLQGDNNLLLTANGRLTNNSAGSLITQNKLTLTTPELYNYGLIQGEGTSSIKATGEANNAGRVLFGGELTLTTPQLTNSGWLQATRLNLNATNASNSGTLLADQQGTLTGTGLTNLGTAQGGNLAVNYQQLTNRGTLLGANQLTITAAQVNQQAPGRLFSGGDLLLHSNGFDQSGQIVALGDATLQLINNFTGRDTIAAGKHLSISSNGTLDNQGTLQGQAITLSAGGNFTNNGQLTTGTGDSSISGNRIAMNGNGTLQGGGNVNLVSRSDIIIDGFTGTRGSLLLSAPGSIVNSALLYAANNLSLYANSIKNQRGDILAGNSLWMQRDAAGNANSEVVNTSGTIETQNGDITVKTGHLLNTRDGLNITQTSTTSPTRAGVGDATMKITIWDLAVGDYGYYTSVTKTPEHDVGGSNGCGCTVGGDIVRKDLYAPTEEAATQKFALTSSTVDVVSNGGVGRISSGRNLSVQAGSLENQASNLLAEGNITLSGNQLNNQSWQAGTQDDFLVYQYKGEFATGTIGEERTRNATNGSEFTYTLVGHENTFTPGQLYRAVIQAGGNVSANFSNDISNTNTTANAGWDGNTLATPGLNSLSAPGNVTKVEQQQLASTGKVAVNSPQWRDQLQNALQQVNGAASLDGVTSAGMSLASHDIKAIGDAKLGNASGLTEIASGGKTLQSYQAANVDVSAYPLPSGNNGYFVTSVDSKSPYLITLNPKLDGLGQLDQNLFGDLNALLGKKPGSAPQETRTQYTDENAFLGSSYLLDRLNLKPEQDYRFLGDAAFDTRYVSNVVLNQTGSRYLNGLGSELDQMRYLMDNAAAAQQSLGLQFGVSLSADQIASLDKSIIWWEASTVNGETVMVPKIYLSPKDVDLQNGSVIAGNNVSLKAGNITNNGSTLTAQNDLKLDSENQLSNLSAGLIQAGGNLQLSALGDINNVGSTISGKTVALESVNGDINNLTTTQQWTLNASNNKGQNKSFTETLIGPTATIAALDSLSLKAGNDINVTSANLSAGGNLLMDAWNDIAVTSNQVVTGNSQSGFKNGWQKIDATSNTTTSSQGSEIKAGGNVAMQAGHNLDVTASTLNAGADASLAAGNDLNLNSAATQKNSSQGNRETHATGVDRTTLTSGGDLTLKAGRDLNSDAAGIAAEGDIGLQAGRDVNLLAAETSSGDSEHGKKKTIINETVRQQSTEIASGGGTTVNSGRDVNSEAAQVTASKDIAVNAGRDINLTTVTDSDYAYKEETKTKKGFLSKKTTHTIKEDSATRENGTLLSGDNVALNAGNNLLVQGSQVVGDDKVTLKAGNNVDIVAATNTDSSWRFSETKKSGLMGTGGLGISIGSSKSLHDLKEKGTTQSQSVSTVGSTGGDVSITAGNQLQVKGGDVVAGGSVALKGDSVAITPGHDVRTRDERFEQRTSGLTLALSGAVAEAVNSAISAAQSAKQESDGRLAALQATKAVLSGVQANQASQVAQANGDPNNGVGISISLTTQQSKSRQHQSSDTVNGSTINAGKDLSITATGTNQGANSGDILIAGSQLKAGGDTSLQAANDIILSGAASTQQTTGKNSSSGGGIGLSFGVGQGSAGLSIFASVNSAKGKEKGNGTAWSETTLDSGGDVSLVSGRDTTIGGATVNGDKVTADIGRDLTISSLQDSDNYDSKQTSVSAGGSFTFGTMTGSGYVNASQDKMHSNYDSVTDQSGIYAGKGGFDITVGNHTQLNGAVIASQGAAADNRLDTGTLGFSDIQNEADYKTEHAGIGVSSGASMGGQFAGNMANTLLAGAGGSGHAEGTTQAAVAEGSIVIRDRANQHQDVGDLSRDTEHANDSISPIFNKEKEQKRLQTAQLIGEIGSQAADIARTQGDINGMEAAKKELGPLKANATQKERDAYNVALRNTASYKAEMAPFGTGSALQQGISAATAAVQGLAGGNVAAAIAGASAPYLAEVIHNMTTDPATGKVSTEANLMAHAVLGAVVAQASGNSALAGAAGATTGEFIAQQLYPGIDRKDLTEEQRQTISALSTLAAGLAGGVAGDGTAGAVAGAQAGKNAVENNNLILPAPVPVPGVPVGPGDQVKQDADKQIASGLDAALKDIGEAIDKATQCSFGRACSEETGDGSTGQPNTGKDLTDAEKAEIGGAGSGTPGGWEPQDEENARNNETIKPNQSDVNNSPSLSVEEQIGILRDAAKGNKGNFGLGQATVKDANALGEAWVGPGYRVSSDGTAWVSSDGLKIYRPPSAKPNSTQATTGVQANFEQKLTPTGRPISNGHLDITK